MKKCPLRAYSGIGGEKMGKCVGDGDPDSIADEGCAWYIHDQCAIAMIGSVSFERMSLYGKSKGYSHHATFGPDPDDMEARLATIGEHDEAWDEAWGSTRPDFEALVDNLEAKYAELKQRFDEITAQLASEENLDPGSVVEITEDILPPEGEYHGKSAEAIRLELESKPLPEETDEAVVEDAPEPDAATDAVIEDGVSEDDDAD